MAGRKISKEEKARLHREAILEAARGLFIRKGYHATTVDEIADVMGATKGTVYYYVSGKDEILFELHNRGMQRLIKNLQEIVQSDIPTEDKLKQAIRSHVMEVCDQVSMPFPADRPEFALPARQGQAIVARRKEYHEIFESIIREGIEIGQLRPVDVKIVSFAIMGALNWIPQWFSHQGRLSREQIAEIMAEYLIRGLVTSDEKRLVEFTDSETATPAAR